MADNTQKDPKDWVSGDDPVTGAQGEQAHKPIPKPTTRPKHPG
ncbi:DUF3072 domain-containing protein [Afipia sp. GAS231]|nr:Protein of unknown function [Afipia sp. GAS231]